MTRSNSIRLLIAILLGGAYCYYFTDWFKTQTIQIIPQNRPMMGMVSAGAGACPVSFMFEQPYKLTSVSVFSVASLQTNKNTRPVWRLASKTNSPPVRGFAYGSTVQGMTLAPEKAEVEPLVPNMSYRIVVQAGKARGEADFVPVGNTAGP